MSTALEFVVSRARRTWESNHSRGLFAWLFRRLGATRPIRGVWIWQYGDGDWEKVRCKGEVIQYWRYDGDGLTVVNEVPELDHSSAIASMTPVISFCVDESAGRMIYQEWHGVRAGHGLILSREGNGEWVFAKAGWVS